MKTKLLVTGTLIMMSMTAQLYAQKTSKKETEQKVKVETTKKAKTMKKLEQVEMEQIKAVKPPQTKMVPVQKRVNHGHIDPITGEQIITPPTEGSFVSITSPKSNLHEGVPMNGKITVKGRTYKGHRVDIRVQTGTVTASNYENLPTSKSRVLEDWRSVNVNADGEWHTTIDVGTLSYGMGGDFNNDEHHFLTILARDTNNRSEIEVLHLTRLKPKD